MNFDDTPEEAAFRTKVRGWLDKNAPKHLEAGLKRAGFASSGGATPEDCKAWQRKKYDAGYACLNWPKEYGGGGCSPIERVTFPCGTILNHRAQSSITSVVDGRA